MPGKLNKKSIRGLAEALLLLRTPGQAERFLRDLCTPGELGAMADRWKVAQLVDRGVPYREIYERTGVSTATITRVARSLTMGSDGYRSVLDQQEES